MNNKNMSKSFLSMLAAGALLFSASAMAGNPTPPTEEPTNEFQRGPDPSVAMLEASSGPYSVRTERVSGLVSGFGGGTNPLPYWDDRDHGSDRGYPGLRLRRVVN